MESRRDVEALIATGLAVAEADVEEAMLSVAKAESAAAGASARVETLEGEVVRARAALDAERLDHRGTTTQLDGATARCASLEAQVSQLQHAVAEERARADQVIAAANERSDGAERRAAMEIEGERMLRARVEKTVQLTAKKFETVLREQIAATEQMNAAEDRLTSFRVQAHQREQELQGMLKSREMKIVEMEAALVEGRLAQARAEAHSQAVQDAIERFQPGRGGQRPKGLRPAGKAV